MILKVNYNKKTHLINTQDKPSIDDLKKSITQTFKSLPDRYALSYIDEDGDQIALQNQQDYQILLSSIHKAVKINIKEINQEFIEYTEKIDIQEKIDDIKESVKEAELQTEKLDQTEKNIESSFAQLDQSIIQEKLKRMMPDIVSKIKSQVSQELTQRSRILNQPVITEDNVQPKQAQKSQSNEKIFEPQKEQKSAKIVHQGVRCDNCQKLDITGVRYKCCVCADYDFCQECQATVQHPHSFLKIKHPKQAPIKLVAVINDQEDRMELNGQRINVPQGHSPLINLGLSLVSSIFDKKRYCTSNRDQKNNTKNCCPFRNAFKKSSTQTETQPQKAQEEKKEQVQKKEVDESEEMKPKIEEKVEPKKQQVPIKTEAEEKPLTKKNQQKIVKNAKYMASFGFEYNKCYQWARTYSTLSKEQLLEFCLNQPEFLN